MLVGRWLRKTETHISCLGLVQASMHVCVSKAWTFIHNSNACRALTQEDWETHLLPLINPRKHSSLCQPGMNLDLFRVAASWVASRAFGVDNYHGKLLCRFCDVSSMSSSCTCVWICSVVLPRGLHQELLVWIAIRVSCFASKNRASSAGFLVFEHRSLCEGCQVEMQHPANAVAQMSTGISEGACGNTAQHQCHQKLLALLAYAT